MSEKRIEKWKSVLAKLREKYGEDWKREEKRVMDTLKEIRHVVNSSPELTDVELEQIFNSIDELPKDFAKLFWFIGPVGADRSRIREILNDERFKRLLRVLASEDEREIEGIKEIMQEALKISYVGITTASTWMAIFRPDLFMPIWGWERQRGTVPPELVRDFEIERFWGVDSDVNKFFEFIEEVREASRDVGISNMVETAFYLSKYLGQIRGDKGEELKKQIEKMDNVLNTKKQVILYGSPGTGKTWLAKNFAEENAPKTYKITKRDVLENVRFFWWTINPNRWDYTQLEEGKSEGMWYGQLKKAFDEINDGDIVFVYIGGKVGKIYAVGTYEEKDGKPHVKVQKILDGPTWRSLKDDPVLRNSLPVKMGARGTLFPLNSDEGLRICKLSNLNLSELGLSLEEYHEEVERRAFVTFHPSYAYEEFVEGLRPETDEENRITYKVKEGIFKRICRNAYNALLNHAGVEKEWKEGEDLPTLTEDELNKVKNSLTNAPKFYLIIDEINRGDISRIFGELVTLLEADKRLFAENELTVILPYSKEKFGIPPNLYIIGTMNTADRSIALIDVALRRRFGFVELMPNYEVLEEELLTDNLDSKVLELRKLAIDVLRAINSRIKEVYDRDHQIGHSYLIKLGEVKDYKMSVEKLKTIWYYEILPLLQEYFYDSPEKLRKVLNGKFVEVGENYFDFREEKDFVEALKEVAKLKTEGGES